MKSDNHSLKGNRLKVLDLFSGIGGFSLGLERTGGFETVAFCEIEEFPRKVLKKHWPEIPIYEDVRELTYEKLLADTNIIECEKRGDDKANEKESGSRGNKQGRSRGNDTRKSKPEKDADSRYRPDGNGWIDVITGGFPCQDISVAGNQAGIGEGTRSGLWSECARLLGDIRPRYAIFENVTALISGDNGRWFEQVLWDISKVGYDAEWHCIPASELGAHHHRDRVWIICYPKHDGLIAPEKRESNQEGNGSNEKREKPASEPARSSNTEVLADPQRDRLQRTGQVRAVTGQAGLCSRERWDKIKRLSSSSRTWATEPDVGRVANGIPDRTHRLKGLGNAVVPQIPELIGRAILDEMAKDSICG